MSFLFKFVLLWKSLTLPLSHLGLTTNEEKVNELIKTLEAKLDVYDKILSKQKYLAGDEITLADLFHIPYAVLLPAAGSNALEVRPNVAR